MPRLLTRPLIFVPVVLLLVIIGAGIWFWVSAGSSTGVSGAAALRDYGAPGSTTSSGPRARAWTYRVKGSETVGVGPIQLTRDLPPDARLVVRPSGNGYWRTLALSEEHGEGVRFEVGPKGTREVARRTTVTVAGVGREDNSTLRPPPLVLRRGVSVGDAWLQHYRLRQVTVDARVRVPRRDVVRVGERDVPVLVIRTTADITGMFPGQRTDTQWIAPSLALPARLTIEMEIGGRASLQMTADLTLTSTEPVK